MKNFIYSFALLLLIVLSGCQTGNKNENKTVLNSQGIPQEKYYVGSGFSINYKAPTDGTGYIVQPETKQVTSMASLQEGQTFGISTSYGAKDIAPKLYFVPSDKKESPADKCQKEKTSQSCPSNKASLNQASLTPNNNIVIYLAGISDEGDINAFIVKNGEVYRYRYQNQIGVPVIEKIKFE